MHAVHYHIVIAFHQQAMISKVLLTLMLQSFANLHASVLYLLLVLVNSLIISYSLEASNQQRQTRRVQSSNKIATTAITVKTLNYRRLDVAQRLRRLYGRTTKR